MDAKVWYWVILILWVLLSGIGFFRDDVRIRRGGDVVLIVLLVLLGYIVSGSPVK